MLGKKSNLCDIRLWLPSFGRSSEGHAQPRVSPRHLSRGNVARRWLRSRAFIKEGWRHVGPRTKPTKTEVVVTIGENIIALLPQ
jgi:hypothetical protein